MRDTLPKRIQRNESGIVNLDSIYGYGTHWVLYTKRANKIKYFDSFGNLRPSVELTNYVCSSNQYPVEIVYNYTRKQSLKTADISVYGF